MDVDPKKPTLYFRVKDLWPASTVSIFGIDPPDPGEVEPNYFILCHVKSDETKPCSLQVVSTPPVFRHAGLAFVVTARPGETGTVTVEVMRDQDTPTALPFERPIFATVKLERANDTLDLEVEQSLPLAAK